VNARFVAITPVRDWTVAGTSELAEAFHIPEEKVRVIVPDTGSGYGGVKLVWTREEEFNWAYFRPAGVIEVSSGVKNDGTVTAWEFHNYNSGGSGIQVKYDFANQNIQFHNSKSPLRQGSYRGLAATANHFARRSAHGRVGPPCQHGQARISFAEHQGSMPLTG
jgi:isoquinoline 1-oxidoreductase